MVTATIYLSHEGLTKRGANEIASYLFNYLTIKDREGVEEINLFCDGCPGQNKNTITPEYVTLVCHSFIFCAHSVPLLL